MTITLWADRTSKGLLSHHQSPIELELSELELKAFLHVPQVPEVIPFGLGGLYTSYLMGCLVLFFEMGLYSVTQADLKLNM